jgi:hypothetical protein
LGLLLMKRQVTRRSSILPPLLVAVRRGSELQQESVVHVIVSAGFGTH